MHWLENIGGGDRFRADKSLDWNNKRYVLADW